MNHSSCTATQRIIKISPDPSFPKRGITHPYTPLKRGIPPFGKGRLGGILR
jgi:hypothetical protein